MGLWVGEWVGLWVGERVGLWVGEWVGLWVGEWVGLWVGDDVHMPLSEYGSGGSGVESEISPDTHLPNPLSLVASYVHLRYP